MIRDGQLRALHKLAERVDGEELERVLAAIVARRAALQCDEDDSLFAGGPQRAEPWAPEPEKFRPLTAEAVAVRRAAEARRASRS